MIKKEDLEKDGAYNWDELVISVKFVGEDLVVFTHKDSGERSLGIKQACAKWTNIVTNSHGDEDIMDAFESEYIERLSYIPEASILFVTFKANAKKVYMYHEVDAETWKNLQETPSKGQYFSKRIKMLYTRQTIYPFTQFGDDDDGYGEHVEVES